MKTQLPGYFRKTCVFAVPILVAACILWPGMAPVLFYCCMATIGAAFIGLWLETRVTPPPTLQPRVYNPFRFSLTAAIAAATLSAIISWMIRIRM